MECRVVADGNSGGEETGIVGKHAISYGFGRVREQKGKK
jgi:hypothetical protein